MSKAVVFTSKFGTTRRAAEYIAKALEADLFDIKQKTPALDGYDTVVFGSGIYMGKMPRSMRTFITDNVNILSGKRTALFVCCTYEGAEAEKQLSNAAKLIGNVSAAGYLSNKRRGGADVDRDAADSFIDGVR